MKKTIVAALFLCFLPLSANTADAESECQGLEPYLPAGAGAVTPLAAFTGPDGFRTYRSALAEAARKAGNPSLAGRVEALEGGKAVPAESAGLASCLVRHYLVARYGERIVSDLQEMVGFRTFAEEGKENWTAPEFVKQGRWLAERASQLKLDYKGFDGRVEEITLARKGDLKPILAVLTHGDVQGVEGQHWASSPWEAKIVDGRIIGRGTEDDKGPIVVTLYALAALRDTEWPMGWSLRLLISNAEESSWEEIPYYLARAPMPDRTLGVDASYPVTHAQKAYGLLHFKAEAVNAPSGGSWRVVRMAGGSGNSIIPEGGEAVLEWIGDAKGKANARETLTSLAARWTADHPGSKLSVSPDGPSQTSLKVEAQGRGGHTSEPTSGHNALGDLTAFLAGLDLRQDAWGSLASFIGTAVGLETDGASLGIARQDPVIGPLTSCLVFLLEQDGQPAARVNIRVPRGITAPEMEKSLADRAAAFQKKDAGRIAGRIATSVQLFNEAHLVPAEGEVVSGLLAVWKEITGTAGKPVAIGGGTQARLFQGGVDFGPAWPGKPYRGHGTDEYLTVEELYKIGELTIAALWKLGR